MGGAVHLHFTDRSALLSAMLDTGERRSTEETVQLSRAPRRRCQAPAAAGRRADLLPRAATHTYWTLPPAGWPSSAPSASPAGRHDSTSGDRATGRPGDRAQISRYRCGQKERAPYLVETPRSHHAGKRQAPGGFTSAYVRDPLAVAPGMSVGVWRTAIASRYSDSALIVDEVISVNDALQAPPTGPGVLSRGYFGLPLPALHRG